MATRKIRPSIRLLLQLEEAKIGDPERLKEIKKILETSQQVSESDNLYLQDLATQLQQAVEQQVMDDWGRDYVQKLQDKETSYDKVKELEMAKNTHKIDPKLLEHASNHLKDAVENEKKIEWTLDLIARLKVKNIGDRDKLVRIEKLLETGQAVEASDVRYLKEITRYIKQLAECKKKIEWTKYAIDLLQANERRHSKKFEEIMDAFEKGKLVSQRDIRYLNARYEKMLQALDQRNRINWTVNTIEKLEESKVGDSEKLDAIKQLLEDDVPVPENDVKYLREQHRLLRQMLKIQRNTELAIGMIEELQEMEIGNSAKLDEIKLEIKERRHVKESQINYLAEKYALLVAAKKSEKKYEMTNGKAPKEIDCKSILTELNASIIESENSPIKISK